MGLFNLVLMMSGSSSMQWSFSNKVSVVPQLLSFKASQNEKQRKVIVDPLVSSDTHRPQSSKNVASNKKPVNQYAMAVYPINHTIFSFAGGFEEIACRPRLSSVVFVYLFSKALALP
ncbi:protein TIFY 6B-like isoform X1 [Cucumis melo var. makuwa]|uniref:Protein TIFY 6B-like isoform X1 n=1 Tax=Cucumis melo var. makuwa TaxID=1194695 RepID=A0A5D3BSU5_CUCMM|nr:protein TIFY 6B-like isoform X1 [Cucumis melo var. makuwa]